MLGCSSGRRLLLMLAAWLMAGIAAAHGPEPVRPFELSAEERAWLESRPRLRVFTKTEWAPIDLYTYEGQFRGLSGDYLALIAQRLGVTFELRSAPTLAAALDALRSGDADILPSVARTTAREQFMDFSRPYLDVPNIYVARRGVAGVGPEQPMAGLRVAAEQGYAVISLVRERHPAASIVEFEDSAAALRAVSEGTADVYLGALPTTSFLVEKMLLANLEVRSPSHSNLSALHLGVSKGERMLLAILDKALADITLAERQDIHRRWVPLHSLLAAPSPPLALDAAEARLVATTPALRIGYEVDYRPYTFRGADKRLAGMADDYLRSAAEKVGLRIGEASGGSWSEVLQRARRGEVDLLIAVAANEERAREFLFVGPWLSTPNVLITRHDAVPVLGLAQYVSRRVAVLRDGQSAHLMRKLYPQVPLLEVATRDELLAAVANGLAEASLVNATFAAERLAQGLGDALKMAGFFPELNSDLYFAVRRDQPGIAALLERALGAVNSAERAAIGARWAVLPGPRDVGAEAREALRRLLPLFAVVLAALVVSLLWGLRLRREVAARRAAEATAAAERDRAEALARARHDFLAVASHEIRTPVNAVVGALGRLLAQPLPAPSRDLASLARRAAQTLSEYVNNLLDLSKSDAGELTLVLQPDSLATALQAALEAIQPVAQGKGIEVSLTLDRRLAVRHRFDAFRVRQVLLNLLSNAVRFSTRGAVQVRVVVVAADAHSQRVRIGVRDEGEGIEAQRLPLLFRPYAQGGESLAHRSGGSGLGLALCKRLVDAMGGRIDIESAPRRGTLVTVELPLELAPGSAGSAPAADAPPVLRVLLVEDDAVQQIVLEAMLDAAGCVVDVAASVELGQLAWAEQRHRLVITDMQLPGRSGIDFARWLRAQPGGAAVRLIAASADLGDAEDARTAGIERLLHKPVPQALIEDIVASLGAVVPAAETAATRG